ncbi:UNVERIFIED_CONTAM: hypothetical protein RKD50_009695 [Streptomyces canus]
MLASLLPGLRDLRTPLTVGYLWLICGWLWFHDVLPQRDTARGAIADLFDLDGILPPATVLAAVTFIAYFLGSIVELDIAAARRLDVVRPNRTAWEAIADRFHTRLGDAEGMTPEHQRAAVAAWQRAASSRTTKRITLRVDVELDQLAPGRPSGGPTVLSSTFYSRGSLVGIKWNAHYGSEPPRRGTGVAWRGPDLPISHDTLDRLPVLTVATLYALWDELPDLVTQLLIERSAVFDRYDRLLAEASIRINMFPPVAALVTTLALRAHWLWWLGLFACAALLYQGLVQRSRAVAVVLDSVATRLVDTHVNPQG